MGLAQMEKAKGTQGQLTKPVPAGDSIGPRTIRGPIEQPKTLSDMGLTYDQSSTYQRLAKVPEVKIKRLIERF